MPNSEFVNSFLPTKSGLESDCVVWCGPSLLLREASWNIGLPNKSAGRRNWRTADWNVAVAHLIIVLFWHDFVDPERRKEIMTAERVHLHLYSLLSTKRLV
jgi:hypothetical protein